jgi:hypothetical protein
VYFLCVQRSAGKTFILYKAPYYCSYRRARSTIAMPQQPLCLHVALFRFIDEEKKD